VGPGGALPHSPRLRNEVDRHQSAQVNLPCYALIIGKEEPHPGLA